MKYLALLLLPLVSNAYHLQVIYSGVKDPDKAIPFLENKESYAERDLSTLCALYIMKKAFIKAGKTCDRAVEEEGSFTAYNNRGVLRAKLGDITGALEDFGLVRVHPDFMNEYVNNLSSKDVRVIASNNYSVMQKFKKKRPQVELPKAEVEEIQ